MRRLGVAVVLMMLVVAGPVALVVLGTAVVAAATSRGTVAPNGALHVAAGLGWFRVPAGTFLMGCGEADTSCLDNEHPRHEGTFLQPFELMAAEVTVGQYARFPLATG